MKKIAVTGSVGKTSVRDMIYYVVNEKYRCGRNLKNFNNFIGLPLSIFQFDDSLEVVVLEMGMSDFGEIDRLGEYRESRISAVITNIGDGSYGIPGQPGRHLSRRRWRVAGHIAGRRRNCRDTLVSTPWDGEFLTRERTAGAYSSRY